MRYLAILLLCIGCTQHPAVEEGAIYESLLTQQRIKIDRTGSCDPVTFDMSQKHRVEERYGEGFNDKMRALNLKYEGPIDSVQALNPGASYLDNDMFIEQMAEANKLLMRHDTYTDSVKIAQWDAYSSQNLEIYRALENAEKDSLDMCAFTINKRGYISDVAVYTFKELTSDWKRLN